MILTLSDNHSGTTAFDCVWRSAWLRPLDARVTGGVSGSTRLILPKFANLFMSGSSAQSVSFQQAFDYRAARTVATVSGSASALSEWGTMEWGIGEWNPSIRVPVRVPLAGSGVSAQFGLAFSAVDVLYINRCDVLFKVGRS